MFIFFGFWDDEEDDWDDYSKDIDDYEWDTYPSSLP